MKKNQIMTLAEVTQQILKKLISFILNDLQKPIFASPNWFAAHSGAIPSSSIFFLIFVPKQ
jgi:hypothetical protein